MVFEILLPELQNIVKKRFVEPTLPQKMAIKPISDGKNVLLISQTGTGKTEATMLPIFNLIMKGNPQPISTLYITPLKSLNRDLLDRLVWWCNQIGIEMAVRHGDTTAHERRQHVEFPPQLLIVTLETLQPILVGKKIRELLRNVKYVILDEVHEMVDSKRGVQLSLALERLKELCGDFQLIMLSATVGEPEKVAQFFAGGRKVEVIKTITPKAMDIQVINPKTQLEDKRTAKKLFVSSETAARLRTIMDMISSSRSALSFTNTREFAEILASRIKTIDKKFPIEVHHSSLSKDVRIKTEKQFKEEKIKSIICTSSLQLGIDIGSVDNVLQYMSPREVSQIIQRAGRSGHDIERISKGIIISTDEDDIFESAVIARKAMNEELEKIRTHDKALDVLAHQIVGMTLENWKIPTEQAYGIIKRAYPYRDLSFQEFLSVCNQLKNLGLVFLNGEIKKKRRGFEYYFNQLSTIPDTKQFRVYNSLENSFVGVLDEEFVALHGQPNTTFIVKGEAWRIVDVTEDKIFVEPTQDLEAAIPGWEGELIPVPFEVSQEVGELRRNIKKSLEKNEDIKNELRNRYPIDGNSAEKMIRIVKKQMKCGIVPDDRTILIEDYENMIIIHSCFGSKINETLGRYIVALLSSRVGSVGMKTDPYRIMIQFQVKPDLELIKEILYKNSPEFLQSILELSLSKSELFEWKFVHVAKRFGAISRDASYGKIMMGKIIDSYIGSPIYKETLKELETEKLDMEKAIEIIRQIQSKDIKVVFKSGLSPMARIGIKHQYAEVIGPERPEREIFELFKHRLLNTKIRMVCVNCGDWDQMFVVKDLPEDLKCKKCDARLLGIVHPKNLEIVKIIKKRLKRVELNPEENERFERVRKTADLFLTYRNRAVICLAGKGVGPETTKRILAKFHRDDEDLFRDILDAERNYLKTKRYWNI